MWFSGLDTTQVLLRRASPMEDSYSKIRELAVVIFYYTIFVKYFLNSGPTVTFFVWEL